ARTPQQLLLQRPRLEQEALNIRDQRESILRAREEIEEERRVFWKKNRGGSRASLSVEVSEISEHNFYTGISGAIEEGGLFIDLTLSLPGHAPMQLAGEVRWIREYNEFTADVEPGLGVGFLRLSDEARHAIGAFMNVRQPLLYEMV
ncbi:PilZ domain-containing protein, partial [Myxococcota bacterium]